MLNIKLDYSALLDLSKDFELLSRAETTAVLRAGAKAGAEIMAGEVRNRAPKLSGNLSSNVKTASGGAKKGRASYGVVIRGTALTGKNTPAAASKNDAFYWLFQEMGTSNMEARPFIRPAFDANVQTAADAVIEHTGRAIDKVFSK